MEKTRAFCDEAAKAKCVANKSLKKFTGSSLEQHSASQRVELLGTKWKQLVQKRKRKKKEEEATHPTVSAPGKVSADWVAGDLRASKMAAALSGDTTTPSAS